MVTTESLLSRLHTRWPTHTFTSETDEQGLTHVLCDGQRVRQGTWRADKLEAAAKRFGEEAMDTQLGEFLEKAVEVHFQRLT